MARPKRTLDVLLGWDLLQDPIDVNRYTMTDWSRIGAAVASVYDDPLPQVLGGCHVGMFRGTRVIEGHDDPGSLALAMVLSETLWLPDPLFSFLAREAGGAWAMMPESGGRHFTAEPVMRIDWRGLWAEPAAERRSRIRAEMPRILGALRAMRPLIEAGAVRLFPWERYLLRSAEDMQAVCRALVAHPDFERLTQGHLQKEYNLAVRVGSVGVELTHGFGKLPKGTPLWFGDKAPVALMALLHLLVTSELGASFVPELPGDRDLFDFIRSGGEVGATQHTAVSGLRLPRLSAAVWPDVVAVRKSSESLATLRKIVADAGTVEEARAVSSIADRLRDAGEAIKEETSVWRVAKDASAELTLGVLGGALAGPVQSTAPKIAAIAAALGGAGTFLWKLRAGIRDGAAARTQADVLMRIADRL
jgi:hypothetical protein